MFSLPAALHFYYVFIRNHPANEPAPYKVFFVEVWYGSQNETSLQSLYVNAVQCGDSFSDVSLAQEFAVA